MNYLKLSFQDAVETLAERFHVALEIAEKEDDEIDKGRLKQALESANSFFQSMLLHTKEGQQALSYLYSRGCDLDFIRLFGIGLAPKTPKMLRAYLHHLKFSDAILQQAGLITPSGDARYRDFFIDRITFPIRNGMGTLIGFSARKYKEETMGGKYINTSETPLFKKSKILFGLNFCRRKIAKERQVILVEGQLDALRMIASGYAITVAAQGTAFGEGHLHELTNLGVKKAFLAFDGDSAGREATDKVGHLLQKASIDVLVLPLSKGQDPDSILLQKGPPEMERLLSESTDYLSFLVGHLSVETGMSPAGKNELAQQILKRMEEWDDPVMAFESRKKLAQLLHLPEAIFQKDASPPSHIQKTLRLNFLNQQELDGDRILETDLLRWLFTLGPHRKEVVSICQLNLQPSDFHSAICRHVFIAFMEEYALGKPLDLLALLLKVDSEQGQHLFQEIYKKKIKKERWQPLLIETIQKMLDRNWMQERELIKTKIHSGQCSEDELFSLLKQFDAIKKEKPVVKNQELIGEP
ncbi:MAG: dnaG [Chlamydiales bacterium]|nr:dnaG [Chlamydiales bacterium]